MTTETQIMQFHTVNFGDIEVPEDKILMFKEGLPGFPQIHTFTMLEYDELRPFQYLQALEEPLIALLVINPFLVDPGYYFELTPTEMEEIKSSSTADVSVYVVATVPANPEESTLNLKAPIVINEVNRQGKQVILHDSDYSVKHPLLNALKKDSTAGQ